MYTKEEIIWLRGAIMGVIAGCSGTLLIMFIAEYFTHA